MEKQSDLPIDAMQCQFDTAGKLWLKINQAPWQEAALVLQSKTDNTALKLALQKLNVVWVPTEHVSLMAQFVPGKRQQDWLAALPYALEESLSEPVENVHCVVLNRNKNGIISVAVVSKSRMQYWVDQLQNVGLEQARLIADCFKVPVAQGLEHDSDQVSHQGAHQHSNQSTDQSENQRVTERWSVFDQTEQRCLVRTGDYAGFASSLDWYPSLLAVQTKLHGSIETRHLETCSTHCAPPIGVPHRQFCQKINLRTGPFQARAQRSGLFNLWLWPSALLGLLVLVYMWGLMMQTQQFQTQAQAYKTQTEALFKQRFPEIKRMVNMQAQAKAAFDPPKNTQNTLGPSQLITQIEPVFKTHPKLQIQRLDWNARSAQLTLSLQAPQLSTLQTITTEVQALQRAQLKVKNVSQTLAEGVLYVDAN